MSVGDLAAKLCVISSGGLLVAAGSGGEPAYVLNAPSINRGGIAVESGGVWSLVAPRHGIYRLTMCLVSCQAWLTGGPGPGNRAVGEWHASATFGDAFVALLSAPSGLGPTAEVLGGVEVPGGSAIVEADAGTVFAATFNPGAAADHDPAVAVFETALTLAVELVRR